MNEVANTSLDKKNKGYDENQKVEGYEALVEGKRMNSKTLRLKEIEKESPRRNLGSTPAETERDSTPVEDEWNRLRT